MDPTAFLPASAVQGQGQAWGLQELLTEPGNAGANICYTEYFVSKRDEPQLRDHLEPGADGAQSALPQHLLSTQDRRDRHRELPSRPQPQSERGGRPRKRVTSGRMALVPLKMCQGRAQEFKETFSSTGEKENQRGVGTLELRLWHGVRSGTCRHTCESAGQPRQGSTIVQGTSRGDTGQRRHVRYHTASCTGENKKLGLRDASSLFKFKLLNVAHSKGSTQVF